MSVYWPIAKGFDVIMVAGQSNAYGAGLPYDEAMDTSGGSTFRVSSTGYTIVDAAGFSGIRIGFGIKFARDHYVPNRLASDREVLLVQTATGGTGFSDGKWVVGGESYTAAVVGVNKAIQSRMPGRNRLVAMLWAQGEADTSGPDFAGTLTIQQYKDAQAACFAGLRSEISGAAGVPIVLTNIRPEWATLQDNGMDLFDAIAATPGRVANCAYADPTGLAGNHVLEEFHYDTTSQAVLADRLWDAFASL